MRAISRLQSRRRTLPLSKYRTGRSRFVPLAATKAKAAGKYVLSTGLVDYYEVLGVDDDASSDEVKRAYRALAKECHPDYLGDKGHDICILLNEAYQTLSNAEARIAYNQKLEVAIKDDASDFTGHPLSKWIPASNPKMAKHKDPNENRAVFVDEITCIGCKNCVWCAPATFRIEEEYGRSRVFAQWLEPEDTIQTAIDSCPVSCIHWVQRQDLAALEYVTRFKTARVNVGVMMAGQGAAQDVWAATERFTKDRRRAAEERARQPQYSPVQEEARRRAAEQLLEQNMGWFARVMGGLTSAMSASVSGSGKGVVGSRKRRVSWRQRQEGAGGGSGYSVPPERALVPVSVYAAEKR